jgi:hypothetical protein
MNIKKLCKEHVGKDMIVQMFQDGIYKLNHLNIVLLFIQKKEDTHVLRLIINHKLF